MDVKPIELRTPEKPIQVEAQIKAVEIKQVEIKPVQVQLPKEEIRITASGIPEKIKLEWEAKPLPLDLRWPKDPLKVSMDLKNESAELEEKELTKKITMLEIELNSEKKQISNLNDKLTTQRENYRQELERQLHAGKLSEPDLRKRMQEFEIRTVSWWATPPVVFVWIVVSGVLGGFSISVVESFRRRRERQEQWDELERIRDELDAAVATHAKRLGNDDQRLAALDRLWDYEASMKKFRERYEQDFGGWKLSLSEWVPAVILGIVAALMVPAALYFIPGARLQAAAENPYILVSLCSLCFVFAMLGELFVDAVLRRFRRLVEEWADDHAKK